MEDSSEGRAGRVKNKPRHPGPRGKGELGEEHHSQQFYLAQVAPIRLPPCPGVYYLVNTASGFKLGIPKETSRESAAEVAYARSYEEPTPGSGGRPFERTHICLPGYNGPML